MRKHCALSKDSLLNPYKNILLHHYTHRPQRPSNDQSLREFRPISPLTILVGASHVQSAPYILHPNLYLQKKKSIPHSLTAAITKKAPLRAHTPSNSALSALHSSTTHSLSRNALKEKRERERERRAHKARALAAAQT